MMRLRVGVPVRVNRPSLMVRRRMGVQVRVYERVCQASSRHGQGQRDYDELSHNTFIVGDFHHLVKGVRNGERAPLVTPVPSSGCVVCRSKKTGTSERW